MSIASQVFYEKGIETKLSLVEKACHEALLSSAPTRILSLPGRDALVLDIHELPPKPGLSQLAGQARLLHDLASIELQAMELALRTLVEFPEAPVEFRGQLAELT